MFDHLYTDVGNKIEEPGAVALLYAVRDQSSLSSQPPTAVLKNTTGLLRLCLQVFRLALFSFFSFDHFYLRFLTVILPQCFDAAVRPSL